ncbi:50S ribosomal protein L28 [Candidatus Nomurabacteria bacterium]|uniref:Large ribosomal subunit protein bL28 n=1 Tax=candidate division WWE3 bacterium TaxID=2053526 RepID=A0A955IVT6_UNCKA|nr:50S ribosomal protein L28 [candidate division WWE3 bacterium]MCB9823650.1 50S ribosomal protein L28 [Candidatus Nomurabacteria bacterium]MCB9827272.1 50S ribosomal protein L28 [Candidatus Nomurabacteria bacterium]MCB9827445.1 50S ribosomal protein L28 [Candidatus Nomurabacteria bacterium]HXK52776.1 50S ribosomal protein L28 [bacterium]
MSVICEICGKGYLKGNLISTGIGKRVSRRTNRTQKPNIRNKRVEINGQKVLVKMCASCLKRIKYEEKKLLAQNVADSAGSAETVAVSDTQA